MKKKPNLFIVGAAKSGTTSMHNYLSQHPEIFMSIPKEPNYFCRDFRKSDKRGYFRYPNLEDYLKIFRGASEEIVGESSTVYLYSKTSAKQIYEFNSNAKIIIMIRDPVSFMSSLYYHMRRSMDEDCPSFSLALQKEEGRKRGIKIPRGVGFPQKMFYYERSKFEEQIRRFLEFFPKEQIKVIIFDDFVKDPKLKYREVLEFLGVEDKDFLPAFKVHNKGKDVKHRSFKRFSVGILDTLSGLKLGRLFPHSFKVSLRRFVVGLSEKDREEQIPEEVLNRLRVETKPRVIKLNKLLNDNSLIHKDLVSLWGYDKL